MAEGRREGSNPFVRRRVRQGDPGSSFSAPPPYPMRLSVVMPVFNERGTVRSAVDGVLQLSMPGVDIELVIVESNSTDGTRDLIEGYQGTPGTTIVFESKPRGKGHAVREGLKRVTGDVVLIQDADLEYSFSDYPAVLDPIAAGRADFVLGCRHVRGRPMRVMAENRLVSGIINSAHWAFTWLFNLVYGVRLRDPFTMYKVFRRPCIDGVEFVSDRFDFDWELAAKLIRLGFVPLEVPVAYNARSFSGGKKVRFFRDPPTWVVACFRFRFTRIRRKTPDLQPEATATPTRLHTPPSHELATPVREVEQ